jgi:hypothetical protein
MQPTSVCTTSPSTARCSALTAVLVLLCVPSESPQPPWSLWAADEQLLHLKTGLWRPDAELVYGLCRERLLSLRLSMRTRSENVLPFTSHNLLAVTILWLRRYAPLRDLAADTGRTAEYLWRTVRQVVHIMDDCIVSKLIQPVDDSSPISTRATLPNVKIIVDSTHIPLPKSLFKPQYFHAKSATRAAWKFEVACDLSHRIINVSGAFRGGQHDMYVIRHSGLLQQQSEDAKIIGDKGYKGKLGIIHPRVKKRKANQELAGLEDERVRRHELESERSAIENINARLKQWAIITAVHRGQHDHTTFIDPVIRVVCALSNLVLREHPLRQ